MMNANIGALTGPAPNNDRGLRVNRAGVPKGRCAVKFYEMMGSLDHLAPVTRAEVVNEFGTSELRDIVESRLDLRDGSFDGFETLCVVG
jgi:hypothetical protein